jgi:hypothetical protein
MATSSETPLTSKTNYPPLQDAHEIRLLNLQRGSNLQGIKCVIRHTKLPNNVSYSYTDYDDPEVYDISSDELQYESLSYVCGPETSQQFITITHENDLMEETSLGVGMNLWSALRQLRSESEERLLWIDAICIDQGNIKERNHQVALIGMIYNRASKVIVWLGSPDATSVLAFNSMNSTKWAETFNPSKDLATIIERNGKLNAIYTLLTRQYWKRLWIIQEFLMAGDFIIQCGDKICERLRITLIMQWVEISRPIIAETETIIGNIRKSVLARLLHQRYERDPWGAMKVGTIKIRPRPTDLFRLYQEHHGAECQNQRDKVFGLHSLGLACYRRAVPIDYNKSLSFPTILGMLIHHEFYRHRSIPKSLVAPPSNTVVQRFQKFYQELATIAHDSAHQSPRSNLAFETFANGFLGPSPPDSSNTPLLESSITHVLRGYARGHVSYVSGRLLASSSRGPPGPHNLLPWLNYN